MKYAAERNKDETAKEGYEYLAFELPEFYVRRLKKACIDKNVMLNQLIVDIVGDAVKNWPEKAREEQKLSYKRVTVKVPKEIHNKLNARKEETTVSIRCLVMYILALHYFGSDMVYGAVFGDKLPPLPHTRDAM